MSYAAEFASVVKNRNKHDKYTDTKPALGFLAPWIVGAVCLSLIPMLISIGLSFTRYNLITSPKFIGLGNFQDLLADSRYFQSLKVTFTYVIVSVPLQLIAALALAVLLNHGMKGLAFYRSAFYLPSMLGGSVAIAVLWKQVFGLCRSAA